MSNSPSFSSGSLLAGAAALFITTSAQAAPPLTFSTGWEMRALTHRAYDLVDTDDHLPLFTLGVGYVRPLLRGSFELDASYHVGATSAPVHGQLTSQLTLFGVELGGSYRHILHRRLHPYARVFATYDWAHLSFDGPAEWSQTRGGMGAGALVGLSVPVWIQERPGKDSARMSVDVGVGYAARQRAAFHSVKPSTNEAGTAPPGGGEPNIANNPVDVGGMPFSSLQYRFNLTFRL